MSLHRREFLRRSLFGATACATLPSFLSQSLFRLDARAESFRPSGADGPILVIMQMGGGNDSLNMVVPYENTIYGSARSSLVLRPDHGLHLLGAAPNVMGSTDYLGLHPAMANLKRLWDLDELAVVNGVGYPNANLSHFTSFDYWHTARPNEAIHDGWLGRYFDHQCAGCPPTEMVEMARTPVLAAHHFGPSNASIAFNDPTKFNWRDLATSSRDLDLEKIYRQVIGLDHPNDPGLSASDSALAYVQRSAHNAMFSSAEVQEAFGATTSVTFPNTGLGTDFKDVARLIKGGLGTSIYYVHQGGYDTHNNQITNGNPTEGTHRNLLKTLDDALGAFRDEMVAQGVWDRVLVFTFSEFGRKVIQNGSAGTDHGAAESLFVMGGGVQRGFYGKFPDLAAQARVKSNSLEHNLDFRALYRTLLQNWLGVPSSAIPVILPGTQFDPVPLLRTNS